ncbi:hypothetical protein E2C01_012453 [Portunus trituberculatus]|uniref:Uncharacterized protein n=1 Tax=Portunus trituberculatus TaxID=210409 RepID=A0A5B7DE13_PORTR|nr:hypothetical protein [Portunus trituberculatus]
MTSDLTLEAHRDRSVLDFVISNDTDPLSRSRLDLLLAVLWRNPQKQRCLWHFVSANWGPEEAFR